MGRPMKIAFVSMSCRCERRVRTRQGVPCPRSRFERARGRPRVSPARASRARDSDEAEFVKYVRALRRPKRARGERDRAVRREDVVRDARAMPRLPSRARVVAAPRAARARGEARRRRATSRAARERASRCERIFVAKRRRRGGWTRRPRRERRARDARANPWRTEGLDSPKRARGEDAR